MKRKPYNTHGCIALFERIFAPRDHGGFLALILILRRGGKRAAVMAVGTMVVALLPSCINIGPQRVAQINFRQPVAEIPEALR